MKNSLPQIPRLMLITQGHAMRPSPLLALQNALQGGARLIQLREKELSDDQLRRLARDTKQLCHEFDARLIINNRLEIARSTGANLHLPESEMETLPATRKELGNEVLIGASAHSLEAAQCALEQGADYIVFGSVFETASHPGSTPAGLEALREVCNSVKIPVFAVGGITSRNARKCVDAGAHGVAVIRAVWSTPDVGAAVRELLQALET
jgi:thiamine-phosphate pyrophosphorylase